jgi:hypothetical protein
MNIAYDCSLLTQTYFYAGLPLNNKQSVAKLITDMAT